MPTLGNTTVRAHRQYGGNIKFEKMPSQETIFLFATCFHLIYTIHPKSLAGLIGILLANRPTKNVLTGMYWAFKNKRVQEAYSLGFLQGGAHLPHKE